MLKAGGIVVILLVISSLFVTTALGIKENELGQGDLHFDAFGRISDVSFRMRVSSGKSRIVLGGEDCLGVISADDGSRLWKRMLPQGEELVSVTSRGLVIVSNSRVVGTNSSIIRMWGVETGSLRWEVPTSYAVDFLCIFLASREKLMVVVGGPGRLEGFDAKTGQRKWSKSLLEGFAGSFPESSVFADKSLDLLTLFQSHHAQQNSVIYVSALVQMKKQSRLFFLSVSVIDGHLWSPPKPSRALKHARGSFGLEHVFFSSCVSAEEGSEAFSVCCRERGDSGRIFLFDGEKSWSPQNEGCLVDAFGFGFLILRCDGQVDREFEVFWHEQSLGRLSGDAATVTNGTAAVVTSIPVSTVHRFTEKGEHIIDEEFLGEPDGRSARVLHGHGKVQKVWSSGDGNGRGDVVLAQMEDLLLCGRGRSIASAAGPSGGELLPLSRSFCAVQAVANPVSSPPVLFVRMPYANTLKHDALQLSPPVPSAFPARLVSADTDPLEVLSQVLSTTAFRTSGTVHAAVSMQVVQKMMYSIREFIASILSLGKKRAAESPSFGNGSPLVERRVNALESHFGTEPGLLVVAASVRKSSSPLVVFALDIGFGRVLWSASVNAAYGLDSIRGLETIAIGLGDKDSAYAAPLVAIAGSREVVVVDGRTGAEIGRVDIGTEDMEVETVWMCGRVLCGEVADNRDGRHYVLRLELPGLGTIIEDDGEDVVFVRVGSTRISGYRLLPLEEHLSMSAKSSTSGLDLQLRVHSIERIWEIGLEGQVLAAKRPPRRDVLPFPAKKGEQNELEYLYLNPDMIVFAIQRQGSPSISVLVLDGRTGVIITNRIRKDLSAPVLLSVVENEIHLTGWNPTSARYELLSIQLIGQDGKSSLVFRSSSTILPLAPTALGIGSTDLGVSPKPMVMATSTGVLLTIDRRSISPASVRRPFLSLPPRSSITYNHAIGNVTCIEVFPSMLESTISVVSIGNSGVYFVEVTPAGLFDALGPGFNVKKPFLALGIVVLVILTRVLRRMARGNRSNDQSRHWE